ncbi:MAG: M23 family metallopeptidase, partial [Deltaproteobacteria bacterium]|nr:M23 family metallopeptidase [Deltaproteobacteria bacterium]
GGKEELGLGYHLNFINRSGKDLEIRGLRIESFHGNALLTRLDLKRAPLERAFRPLPWRVIRSRKDLAAAHRLARRYRHPPGGLVVPAGSGASLLHLGGEQPISTKTDRLRFTLSLATAAKFKQERTLVYESKVHHYQQRASLELPVRGSWNALASHRAHEPHASLHQLSQTFAYDLTQQAAGGRTFVGDPRKNESYPAYGQSVFAMAKGVIVALNDGVPDNTPGQRPPWQTLLLSPKNMGGNYVIIRHGQGEFSATMHLMPGLKVRVGQQVQAGQKIGVCGNSGNSGEAHVHIQLQDGPNPLQAMGLPLRIGDFSFHYGHQVFYVRPDSPHPLPSRLPMEAGKLPLAAALDRHRRGMPY